MELGYLSQKEAVGGGGGGVQHLLNFLRLEHCARNPVRVATVSLASGRDRVKGVGFFPHSVLSSRHCLVQTDSLILIDTTALISRRDE